jgi:hypothetical protein
VLSPNGAFGVALGLRPRMLDLRQQEL